ncbi:MAG: phenylalanine--tRNA ligase subunit alpha, partial [bacterium]|nr:phenylalanine--tRNA ligase subunit alpha [bacterium]
MQEEIERALASVAEEACAAVRAAGALTELEQLEVRYLGRRGVMAHYLQRLKEVEAAERPRLGRAINEVKARISAAVGERRAMLQAEEDARKLAAEREDMTLPGRPRWRGGLHPLTQTLEEISAIFRRLGFAIEEGPDIEDEWHNFDALNIPATHPARDVQDTFFLQVPGGCDAGNRPILRTHTSPVQIRVMKRSKPPLRFIAPGRVYRNERIDASHYTIFHQVEGLYVDREVSFAQLKGTLWEFAREYYGAGVSLRFRPGYFPFTEPSAEVDVTCTVCGGRGCSVCLSLIHI